MIPRSFRKAETWQLLLIVLGATLLWIPQFGKATLPLCHHSRSILCPMLETFSFSAGDGGIVGQIMAFLLVIGLGLFIIHILSSNHLIDRTNHFPAYVFVLFASYNPLLITLHPVLPALLLLLFALHFLFKSYDEVSALRMVFSAAFCISLASLFYFPIFGFGILPWLALLIFRDFSWRNWTGALLGLITPYLYVFAWIFVMYDWSAIYDIYFSTTFHPRLPELNYPWQVYLFWAFTGIILIRSIITVLWHLNEKVISYRKKQLVMIWFLILSQITLLFAYESAIYHSIILFAPLSFYFTTFFVQGRRKKWSIDLTFLLLLGCLILSYLA